MGHGWVYDGAVALSVDILCSSTDQSGNSRLQVKAKVVGCCD